MDKLRHLPLFLLLLPLFFVLHGYGENYGFVPLKDAALLIGIYLVATAVIVLICKWIFRTWSRAFLMTFLLMAFHFFYGSLHDGLRKWFPGSFVQKYAFLLPLFTLVFIFVIIILRRSKKDFSQVYLYLNVLLLVLIVVDIVQLPGKAARYRQAATHTLPQGFTRCDSCEKPDVYIIIADEYAGNRELKEIFHFDNQDFYTQLKQRGFRVLADSRSNYNLTPYSIASILNMDYFSPVSRQPPLLSFAYNRIASNRLLTFLHLHGYRLYNYTYFDFREQPTLTQETFLPVRTHLITGQTFLSRIEKEIRYHLGTTFRSKRELERNTNFNRLSNDKLYQAAWETASASTKQPKFVVTHLMLPHYPYFFDRNGKPFPFEQTVEGNQNRQANYLEYLQYANGKLLALLDHIRGKSPEAIVVLMSDHGFRHFDKPVPPHYLFSNLAAIHIPGNRYELFSDTMSNVNILRSLLNTRFGQQLPMLKDTSVVLDNP